MVASDSELLPQAVLRQIGDKLYEKRKVAALEVEQIVKKLAAAKDHNRIRLIIDKLITDYAFSNQANYRKGALLCLAAATVGLGEPSEAHLRQLVPPVLASFTDQDSRVRYYACEALYNIAKVAREQFISFFNEVFDAMFRLCADSEANVQSAVQFLDNLVKDIVTASPNFNIDAFIPKLRDYLRVVNPFKRQFLISWITVLDSVPELDMLTYLPQLLDGLMNMLSDQNREIKAAAHKAMMEFLVEIQATRTIDFGSLADILVDKANSQDEFTRLTAIKWLKEFVEMASGQLADHYAEILGAVLPNISHSNREIQQVAQEANNALLNLQPTDENAQQVDTAAILDTISREIRSEQEPTRMEALRWILFLLVRSEREVYGQLDTLLAALLDALAAPSDRVVLQALSVLGSIAAHPQHFRRVLMSLLDRFRGDNGLVLLQKGGSLVMRRLCAHMGAEKVFTEFGSILDDEQDLSFASTMVQALSLILLTAPEVRELRTSLHAARTNPAGAALFQALYPCWCHSAGAVLSLCFLCQAYEHACEQIASFAVIPVGTEVLLQCDRLVQLLETPAFTALRLQLLQPHRYPDLARALYGLLMLLPQSGAFRTLHTRLHAVPTLAFLQLDTQPAKGGGGGRGGSSAAAATGWANFDSLLKLFVERQTAHAAEEERLRAEQEGLGRVDAGGPRSMEGTEGRDAVSYDGGTGTGYGGNATPKTPAYA